VGATAQAFQPADARPIVAAQREQHMKIKLDEFRVEPGSKADLRGRPTRVQPFYSSDAAATALLAQQVARTSELQDILYASNTHALLLIFQAMDAAGKDGAIKHVMSGVNPTGCQVTSFKQPSVEELDHDFLWRTTRQLPQRGSIGIFNRSYYEEVLIVRVHPELLERQGLPPKQRTGNRIWAQRYASIREFEAHLHRNGTHVVKFYLHLSKEEQRRRFLDRIDHPDKNWKFALADVTEREHWGDYRRAYEHCLSATSTADSPWYVVPADDKKNARLIISRVVNQTLESLGLSYPKLDKARLAELKASRRLLER
jgi:PPK2 family polyphosphate:nucleotide phosphotransferase